MFRHAPLLLAACVLFAVETGGGALAAPIPYEALQRPRGASAPAPASADPLEAKLARWTDLEKSASSFADRDAAIAEFAGWPGTRARRLAAERALESSGLPPGRIVAWFDGQPPQTAEGALALATALQASGRADEAAALVRAWWRDRSFEAEVQGRFLARFGGLFTRADHEARLGTLLLGPQGPATRAMLPLVGEEHRAMAEAAFALRADAPDADAKLALVRPALVEHPALAIEQARSLRARGLDFLAARLVTRFPAAVPEPAAAERVWIERKAVYNNALRAQDWAAAYAAVAGHGFVAGERAADAEFFAGWVALRRLNDPARADAHFAKLETLGTTPITRSRAAYWRGRAAEARGDPAAARVFHDAAAAWPTTFYGQLSAERTAAARLDIGREPEPSVDDRWRFEAREPVRAAKLLAMTGRKDQARRFVLAMAEDLPTAGELALLVDLARGWGDPDLALRVARAGAIRGLVLPERGYPLIDIPARAGAAEAAFALSIARQESNFDPAARSGADARGLMQLLPSTAREVAGRLGERWEEKRLYEADYNVRLGSARLGELMRGFGGSYVLAAASYNAGPGRVPQWLRDCGDPREPGADPLDFIECVPFGETRNYVMRTLENMAVYRARLNGGSAPLTASADLARGTPPARAPGPAGELVASSAPLR